MPPRHKGGAADRRTAEIAFAPEDGRRTFDPCIECGVEAVAWKRDMSAHKCLNCGHARTLPQIDHFAARRQVRLIDEYRRNSKVSLASLPVGKQRPRPRPPVI